MFGIKEKTLANWRYPGKGPKYIKRDRIIRYALHDLEEWAESLKVDTFVAMISTYLANWNDGGPGESASSDASTAPPAEKNEALSDALTTRKRSAPVKL